MNCSFKNCKNKACGLTSLNLYYCKKHQEDIFNLVKQTSNFIKANEKAYRNYPISKFLED